MLFCIYNISQCHCHVICVNYFSVSGTRILSGYRSDLDIAIGVNLYCSCSSFSDPSAEYSASVTISQGILFIINDSFCCNATEMPLSAMDFICKMCSPWLQTFGWAIHNNARLFCILSRHYFLELSRSMNKEWQASSDVLRIRLRSLLLIQLCTQYVHILFCETIVCVLKWQDTCTLCTDDLHSTTELVLRHVSR